MTKKKADSSNDVPILEDIIFNQNEKIKRLDEEINSLKEQLEVAYGVNEGLIEEQNDDEKTQNLTMLTTLLLVIMGLTQSYCSSTEYGSCIAGAIKKFYCDMAVNLVKTTDFGLGNKKDEDNEDTEEEWDDDELI